MNTTNTQTIELLCFLIGEQAFGIEVNYVEVVNEKTQITPVPKSKDFIDGLLNLRGRIVPVLDLSKIISLNALQNREYQKVLIINYEGTEVGLYVDDVQEVFMATTEEIEQPTQAEACDNKVNGIIQKNGKLVLFLDVAALIQDCE